MDSSKINVGIIGLGRSGYRIHAHTLNSMSDRFVVVAASDELEERREWAVQDFGCDTYSDYREMLQRSDLDLIVNASPSHLHVPISLEILEAGFHVLCEKPLARKVDEVDRLIAAANKAGKVLAIFQQGRFRPGYIELCNVIESGILGRIVQITFNSCTYSRRWDWQTLKSHYGGMLLNSGAHVLDQALQLFGTDVIPDVYCKLDSANTFGDAEDHCKLILSGEGRPLIDIEISNSHAYPGPEYIVQGTRGGLAGNNNTLEWKYFKPEEEPTRHVQTTPLIDAFGKPAYTNQVEKLKWHENRWDLGDGTSYPRPEVAFYDNLYKVLTEGAPLVVTPEHVRQQVAVIEQGHQQNVRFAP